MYEEKGGGNLFVTVGTIRANSVTINRQFFQGGFGVVRKESRALQATTKCCGNVRRLHHKAALKPLEVLLAYRSGKSEHVTTQAPRTGAQPSHAVLPLESPHSTAVTGGFRPSQSVNGGITSGYPERANVSQRGAPRETRVCHGNTW